MALFPSTAWCEALITAINTDPEAREAGAGWQGDLVGAVLPVPGLLERPFIGWCRPEGGLIGSFRCLEDLEEIDELAPAYEARADYTTWRQLLLRELDPVEALVTRRLRFKGALEPIVARVRFKALLHRAMAKVATEFL